MNIWFTITMIGFIVISATMILIILVQRPQGGGLAGAFGGAGGGSTDTVFGGRVGDALTTITVCAFVIYLGLAIGLNKIDTAPKFVPVDNPSTSITTPATATTLPAQTFTPPVVTPSGTTPGAPTTLEITPVDPADLPFEIEEEARLRREKSLPTADDDDPDPDDGGK